MPIYKKLLIASVIFVSIAETCFSQTPPESTQHLRLEFTIKELDGAKVINNRKYVTLVGTTAKAPYASIRSGNRLPVRSNSAGNVTFTYVEVGVNIDVRDMRDVQNQLQFYISADVSTAAPDTNPPLIRNNKWSSEVTVPLGKATTIFSSDDPTTNHQMQLEVKATPANE